MTLNMEKISKDEPILYRTQCKSCSSFLSIPFEYDYNPIKNLEIKVDRYKGDNINYHSENEYNNKNNIIYSFIYCLKCGEKVGYWISQASKKEVNNINKLFFFPKNSNMVKYDKSQVTEEQHRKFKQEEIFYNSTSLTKDVVDYAKEHIDNFIKNVEAFEKQRTDIKHCHDCFDRKINSIKNFFIKNMQDKKNSIHLNIDFSKNEENNTKKRNIILKNTGNKEEGIPNLNIFEGSSNGNTNLNFIHDDNEQNGDKNNNISENGGQIIQNLTGHSGSDIYLEDKKNNKESSYNNKRNKEPSHNFNNYKKNKRKRK